MPVRRHALTVASGVLALAAAGVTAVLPPRAAVLPSAGTVPGAVVPFAYHVHTNRSDGSGTVEDVADAAARAGLRAVILTDHGDGTRPPRAPAYLHGVLVIDAVEIGSDAGHVVALNLPVSGYRLGGHPRGVVEDIVREGGVPVIAHPGSADAQLRWRDWDAPMAGLEWMNLDSEWRDESTALGMALLTLPFRPAETIASLVDRPAFVLTQWDRLTERGPVVGLGAHDAHARIGVGQHDGQGFSAGLRQPSYEALFRAFANRAVLETPFTGEAEVDARALMHAVTGGHMYSVVDGWWRPARFAFTATADERQATMGQRLEASGPVTFEVAADVPPSADTVLFCRGRAVARSRGGSLRWTGGPMPGACRVEIQLPGATGARPWLVSNPIYAARPTVVRAPSSARLPDHLIEVRGSDAAERWTPESGGGARGRVADEVAATGDRAVRFDWQLPAAEAASPFAAMRLARPAELEANGPASLVVRAQASRPMRVWVQVRVAGAADRRWGRSIALGEDWRTIEVPARDFAPVSDDTPRDIPWRDIDALLVVVDSVNARAGDSGTLRLKALWVAR